MKLGLTSLKEISIGGVAIMGNPSLERLDLVSLEAISDGAINILSNINLCYIESINWTQISKNPAQKITVGRNANQTNICGTSVMNICNLCR